MMQTSSATFDLNSSRQAFQEKVALLQQRIRERRENLSRSPSYCDPNSHLPSQSSSSTSPTEQQQQQQQVSEQNHHHHYETYNEEFPTRKSVPYMPINKNNTNSSQSKSTDRFFAQDEGRSSVSVSNNNNSSSTSPPTASPQVVGSVANLKEYPHQNRAASSSTSSSMFSSEKRGHKYNNNNNNHYENGEGDHQFS